MADLVWEAPAKLNLSLLVRSPDPGGYHQIRSLVQTVEHCDLLEFDETDEDRLEVVGADLPDGGDNLVWKAISGLPRPSLSIRLVKRIPVAAGLGGGSSDAAAALGAVGEITGVARPRLVELAQEVGADVPFFLTGGTAWLEGYGERISAGPELGEWAVAVAVPNFELSTPDVYRRWDRLGGPIGDEARTRSLPPPLRKIEVVRNDLTPAALDLRPELGDWMSDLADRWERPVAMTGSGPALFSFFPDLDEAESAVNAAPSGARSVFAAAPRWRGAGPPER